MTVEPVGASRSRPVGGSSDAKRKEKACPGIPLSDDGRLGSRRRRISLLGLPLDVFTPAALIEHLLRELEDGRGGYLMTPNLDHLRSFVKDDDVRAQIMGADIRVADGMPLIWASRIQRTPLPCRVAGSDLIRTLSCAAAEAGYSAFLVGGRPGAAAGAAEVLAGPGIGLNISGTYCPSYGFETDGEELGRLRDAIVEAEPALVYIGLPLTKATAVVRAVRPALPASWFLGLGMSFSFLTGDVRRAPRWMQDFGLEWLHRLRTEPRRLGRRYLFECLPFGLRLLGTVWLERLSSGLAPVHRPV